MTRQFIAPTRFTAVDGVSPVLDRMSRSAANFANAAESAAARAERKFRKIGNAAENVAKKSAIIGIAVAAPLVLAAKSAIDFEDKMADVAKVANVTLGSGEFLALGEQAKNLGVFLGVGAKEAAGLMQNLAQGGVSIKDLDTVSRIAGKVGVAFGVSADIAGEAFIKTQNALGGTIASTEKLMDALNYLGNTTAASSANLIEFMSSGGSSAARAAGATGEAVAAMGAQLISMGKSSAESATILERFTKNALNLAPLRATFDKAGGGAEGMMAIIEKGSKLSGKAQDAYFRQFGEYGLSVQLLAKNFDQLKSTVASATDTTLTANSVNNEFANRTATTAFKMQEAKARVENLAIGIGSQLLPVIANLLEKITPVIESIMKWTKENPKLTNTLVLGAAAFAALAFAVSGVSMVVAVFSKVAAASTTVQWLWNAAMTANPIGLVIVGVAALIALIAAIIVKWDDWGAAVSIFLGPLGMVISLFMSFREHWEKIKAAFKTGGILEGLKAIGKVILDALLKPVQQLFEILSKLPLVGDKFANAAAKIQEKRSAMWSNASGLDANGQVITPQIQGEVMPALNPMASMQQGITNSIERTNNASVDLNINDPNNRVKPTITSGNVNINTTSTLAWGQ
jgi:TP901 family phage tail tape measure protein